MAGKRNGKPTTTNTNRPRWRFLREQDNHMAAPLSKAASKAIRARARDLRGSGYTFREIAAALHIGKSTAHEMARGIPRPWGECRTNARTNHTATAADSWPVFDWQPMTREELAEAKHFCPEAFQ
jgi:hypothetical protein